MRGKANLTYEVIQGKVKPKTKVIFRKFKKDGQIIAYFPELPGTSDVTTCLSYMHIGQHSAASVTVSPYTVPATEQEYKKLYKELERIGYNLEVVSRFSSLHFDARVRAVNAPKRETLGDLIKSHIASKVA